MKSAPAGEKVEEGLASTSINSGNDHQAVDAVAVGAAAAIHASQNLNHIENGCGDRNRFSPGNSVDVVANCRPEGMDVDPAGSASIALNSSAKDTESASMTSVLTVDLASQGFENDGGSDRRERGGGDSTAPGLGALEGSAKRPRLGVRDGQEVCVGRGDRWQGMSTGGRDSTERSAGGVDSGVVGGATTVVSAAAAAAAVDPVTAPYLKKRKKRGAIVGKKMTEKLRCLDDGVDIGESAKVRSSDFLLFQMGFFVSWLFQADAGCDVTWFLGRAKMNRNLFELDWIGFAF